MKETIYTIPVNEVYDIDCECPLCELERRLETESLEYTLGAAMMEPDFRTETNKKGFCHHHFECLLKMSNKLALSLVLETHLAETQKRLDLIKNTDFLKSKSGLFKKNNSAQIAKKLSDTISDISDSCAICDKINHTMERYADVLLYMWSRDEEFKNKFERSKGVCLKHTKLLLDTSLKSLNDSKRSDFLTALLKKQDAELSRIASDIHRFTLKFDYRNKDMDWGNAQDAPKRTTEKISGYVSIDE